MKINNRSINNTLNFDASIKDAVKLLEECSRQKNYRFELTMIIL